MFQEFYSHSTLLHLPLVALALFIVSFGFAVWHTFRRRDADDIAQLPLLRDDYNELTAPAAALEGGRDV